MTGFDGFGTPGDHGGDRDDGWALPSFRVVVVCGGDLCRSPLAAALLREGLPPGSAVEVTSGGTRAMVGSLPPQRLVRLAARRGLDLGPLPPRQLAREHLERTDLVLTATRDQRATVVATLPGALRRTFTLRELARLLAARPAPWPAPPALRTTAPRAGAQVVSAPPVLALAAPGHGAGGDEPHPSAAGQEVARWSALGPGAAAGRGAGGGHGRDDDVIDPYRRSTRTYRACLAQVEEAVATILGAVGT